VSALTSLEDATSGSAISLDTQSKINDNGENVEKYDGYRNIVFIVLFSLVFLAPVLMFIGLFLRRACPFKCTFCLGPFYCLIIFILFGLHWFLGTSTESMSAPGEVAVPCFGFLTGSLSVCLSSPGMFIGDGCVYMDTQIVRIPEALNNDGILGNVLNSCLTNTSMLIALDVDQKLNFTNAITFPPSSYTDPATIDARFDIAPLNVLTSAVANVTQRNFGFDAAVDVDAPINSMNTGGYVPTDPVTYDRAKIRSCNFDAANRTACYDPPQYSASDSDAIKQLATHAEQGLAISDALDQAILDMNTGAAKIKADTASLKALFRDVAGNVTDIQGKMAPLFASVGLFEDNAYCYFVAVDFGQFKSTFCDNIGDSVQWITFALFIVGLSCIGISWFARWSSYRIAFVPKIAPAPFDENAWMQQNPQLTQGDAAAYTGGQQQMQDPYAAPQQHQAPYDYGNSTEMAPVDNGTSYQPNDSGAAVGAPSYDAALASYKASADASPPADAEVVSPSQAQWIEPEKAVQQETEGQQRPICESCEAQQVAVHCEECEESLCPSCDATLHKSAVNAGHTRRAL
jgi:hypothetical protein